MDEQNKVNIEVVSVDDLIQDDHNFNKGTEEGQQLIERSFRECGAGRSVFIDKDNRLVGGNKAQKGFKAAGKKRVVIVDSDPDTLVAVRRKDVSLDSAEGRRMALLDNLTTQVNLAWDPSEIEAVSSEIDGFDPSDYGFDPSQLEVAGMGDETDPNAGADVNPDDYGDEIGWKGGDKSPFTQITFVVANEQADFINRMLSEAKKQDGYGEEYGNTNSNGNAIYLIVKQWAEQKKLS